jgi:SWI/SNF-related matrix-associated actin-dependent regulator of chromatin subfamily A3
MGLGKTISVVSLMGNTMDAARVFAYGPIQKITLRVPKAAPEPPLTAAHFAGTVWGMPDASGDLDPTSIDSTSALGKNGKGKGKRETLKELMEAARAARIKAKSRATLIVCPLSTIANWEDQFKEHWAGEVTVVGGTSGPAIPCSAQQAARDARERHGAKLKLYVYHGTARRPDTSFLADFDAVITTYSTLATEYSKQTKSTALYEDDGVDGVGGGPDDDSGSDSFSDEGNGSMVIKLKEKKKPKKRPPGAALAAGIEISSPLQQIHWFRVVLDEAQ